MSGPHSDLIGLGSGPEISVFKKAPNSNVQQDCKSVSNAWGSDFSWSQLELTSDFNSVMYMSRPMMYIFASDIFH